MAHIQNNNSITRKLPHGARCTASYRCLFYWLLTWLALALHLGRFFELAAAPLLAVYQLVLIGSYALLFVAPIWALSRLGGRFAPRAGAVLSVLLARGATGGIGDHLLWQLYGFHLNGFVGHPSPPRRHRRAGFLRASTEREVALLAAGLFALQGALRLLAAALARRALPAPRLAGVLPLFVVATLGERISYGVSHFYGYSPLLENAQRMPFYQPLTHAACWRSSSAWSARSAWKWPAPELDGQRRYRAGAAAHRGSGASR